MTDPNKRPLPDDEGWIWNRCADGEEAWAWRRDGRDDWDHDIPTSIGRSLWTLADPERERTIRAELIAKVKEKKDDAE